jgi:hypothetical protein
LTNLGKIQKFLNERLVGQKYHFDDEQQVAGELDCLITEVSFNYVSLTVYVDWSGYIFAYPPNQERVQIHVNKHLIKGGSLMWVDTLLIAEIVKLAQYVDVHKKDVFIEYNSQRREFSWTLHTKKF